MSLEAVREGPQGTSSSRHFRTANEFNEGDGGNDPDCHLFSLVLFLRTDKDRSALIPGRTVWQLFLDRGRRISREDDD